MREDQPAFGSFDGRTAIADLHEFPWKPGFGQKSGGMPEMQVIAIHDEQILIVLAGEHRVLAVDFAREESHALVLDGGPVECAEFEMKEIARFKKLREDEFAIVRGVCRIVRE